MIPTLIEQDVRKGKARFRTFQTGVGGQSILIVPPNSYIVIYQYTFIPAGGGYIGTTLPTFTPNNTIDSPLREFMLQQVSFLASSGFFPFMHHQQLQSRFLSSSNNRAVVECMGQKEDVYIISDSDVAITCGLVDKIEQSANSVIPVTNKTPAGLTYGGSTADINTETIFSPNAAHPISLVQPSVVQFEDYGLGGVPGNPSDQAFAIPDAIAGLIDPSDFIRNQTSQQDILNNAAQHYYLNVKYALYTDQVPEQLG